MHDSVPSLYFDRMLVADLVLRDPRLRDAMAAWNVGKTDRKERVHFCGMIYLDGGQTAVFLPRGIAPTIRSAAMTMSTLCRFGRDASNRNFAWDGEAGNPGMLVVIARLAADFRENGLFRERQRLRTRNTGKPDWKRTVSREQPYINEDGGDVFPDIATTRTIDSNDTLLAQIQTVVLEEILTHHGWWLGDVRSRRNELLWCKRLPYPRAIWPKLLDALLPRLYSARAIFLASMLGNYLRGTRDSASGSFVFGLEDFHSVWEAMLRRTLTGVEDGWNERLPKAVYVSKVGVDAEAPERGMLTDIVLHDPAGYTIVDAKYYAATSAGTAPGWPDIAKQMFYEMSLRSVVGSSTAIRNCFVFPAPNEGVGPYASIEMRARSGETLHGFPLIETIYLPMEKVMDTYAQPSGGCQISLSEMV
jgi:hypothetical protein